MDERPKPIRLIVAVTMLVSAALACIPPQDCMGTTLHLTGYVVDAEDNPIARALVSVWNNGSYERLAFSLTTSTDANGYFETDSTFSYACTSFQLEITKDDYKNFQQTYHPPSGEGWPDEFQNDARVTLQREP